MPLQSSLVVHEELKRKFGTGSVDYGSQAGGSVVALAVVSCVVGGARKCVLTVRRLRAFILVHNLI